MLSTCEPEPKYLISILGVIKSLVEVVEKHVNTSGEASNK